jgi:serine/threonine protein kinase
MDLRSQLQSTLGTTYTIGRELGGGGMSRVFVAEETALGRRVVIKLLSPELAAGVSADRFALEVKLAARLQHANIVPVLAAGENGGLPYYTMPFVDGESLRSRLQRGALPMPEVVGILRDVTRALVYAHEQGVAHRDIKPDNVLLAGGAAVVTDFGIAKAISESRTGAADATPTLTQVGTSLGTPAYMAPEQVAGDPHTDHRADVYSLGVMAYEMLAGRPPFVERDPRKLLTAQLSEVPALVSDLRPDIPATLAQVVMRCLEKDPAARPQAARDILRELDVNTSSNSAPAMPPILLGGPAAFKRAIMLFAGAFIVVAIVAKASMIAFGLPDWVFPGEMIAMALGLPAVLFTG